MLMDILGMAALAFLVVWLLYVVFVSRTKPDASPLDAMERTFVDLTHEELQELFIKLNHGITENESYKITWSAEDRERYFKHHQALKADYEDEFKGRTLKPVPVNEQNEFTLPKFAEYLLYFLPKKERDPLLGDLEEEYHEVYPKFGRRKARIWYYGQVVQSFWPLIVRCIRKLVALGVVGWLGNVIRRLIP